MGDLQSISPDKLEIIQSIRKIFLSANQTLSEDIKYGGVVFKGADFL